MRIKGLHFSTYKITKLLLICYLVYNSALNTIGFYVPRLSIILLIASMFSILIAEGNVFYFVKFKEFKWLTIFVVISAITGLIIAIDRSLVVQHVLFLIETTIVGYLICIVAYRTGEADIVPWAFFIGSLIISVYIFSGRAVVIGKRLTLSEVYNPNTLGVFLVFGGWSFLRICGKMKRHILSVIASVIGSAVLFYLIIQTGSRKSTIGFVLIFILWVLFVFRARMSQAKRSIRIITSFALIASVVFIVFRYGTSFYSVSDTILRRMQDLENSEGSWTIRLSLIIDALSVFIHNPVFGVGLNNYKLYSTFLMYSHNTYTEVLACTGLLGGCAFFMTLVTPIKIVFSKITNDIRNKKDKVNDGFNFSLVIAFLIICMTQICIYNQNLMMVLAQIMAISVVLRNNQDWIKNGYENN